jgi:hypothetical protein
MDILRNRLLIKSLHQVQGVSRLFFEFVVPTSVGFVIRIHE